jgi:hypothetical protein
MDYVQKPNTGSLWNEAKELVSKDGKPFKAYSGSALVDGKEYYINAFLNDTKTGKQVYNMTFVLKPVQPAADKSAF